ncbi:uncharacterized protein LOC134540332 [Bacillus rossius redtenbacheri]|uniref:uncharacterized protein LOC134540332 n=1 Tax=Bacillus rossius redtenbacheri TaxID=93214 RepID=UPI002FDDBB45
MDNSAEEEGCVGEWGNGGIDDPYFPRQDRWCAAAGGGGTASRGGGTRDREAADVTQPLDVPPVEPAATPEIPPAPSEKDARAAMWGRHAALVVWANLLAAGLLLAVLVYCWPRAHGPSSPLYEVPASRRPERGNCARMCVKNEPPRECYFEFVVRPHFVVDIPCEADVGRNTSNCDPEIKATSRRLTFAINGQLPGPPIQVCAGDAVLVDVLNRLPGRQLALHWHGARQKGTPHMDGVAMVTQCPIPSSGRFTYSFRATEPGTHFYRAHAASQHAAGVFGALVVRQPPEDDPHSGLRDHDLPEHTLLLHSRRSGRGEAGPATLDVSSLTAAGARARPRLAPGSRHLLRLVNAAAADCPALLGLDYHPLLVVAKDGGSCEPLAVRRLVLLPGERYDVVVNANQTASSSYKLRIKGYNACSGSYEETDLVYLAASANESAEDQQRPADKDEKRSFLEACPDALACRPPLQALGAAGLRPRPADVRLYLPFDVNPAGDFDGRVDFRYLHDGAPYYPAYLSAAAAVPQFGRVSFLPPSSPLLSQLRDVDPATLCSEGPECDARALTKGFCECTHVVAVPLGASVEILLVDLGHGSNESRTFHLHGLGFRELGSRALGRALGHSEVLLMDSRELPLAAAPSPLVDTAAVPNKGYSVWRLRADNPGFWLLESRGRGGGDVADDSGAGPQLVLRVGRDEDIPAAPAGFPRCGTFKGPDFLFT